MRGMLRELFPQKFGIPNWLSVFRLCLIPVFVLVLFLVPHSGVIAAAILIVSSITDILDGIIARRFHMTTELGKVLDPFADKLTQVTVCVCLVLKGLAPWWLFVLFVAEVLMILGGVKMVHQGKTLGSARWFGKLGTVVFYVIMISIIVLEPGSAMTDILIAISLFFMLFAFVMYIPVFVRVASQKSRHDGS